MMRKKLCGNDNDIETCDENFNIYSFCESDTGHRLFSLEIQARVGMFQLLRLRTYIWYISKKKFVQIQQDLPSAVGI